MFGGPPNKLHLGLYKAWGISNWGMILTGNVQVSRKHLSLGRDIVVPEELTDDTIRPFKMLASAMHNELEDVKQATTEPEPSKSLALMQLSHGGRQSCNVIGGRRLNEPPLAPSPVRVTGNKGGLLSNWLFRAMFQTPKEMTLEDIDDVVQSFVRGALLAQKSGFDGVQLHVAHGCMSSMQCSLTTVFVSYYFVDLLSEFLSPKVISIP